MRNLQQRNFNQHKQKDEAQSRAFSHENRWIRVTNKREKQNNIGPEANQTNFCQQSCTLLFQDPQQFTLGTSPLLVLSNISYFFDFQLET